MIPSEESNRIARLIIELCNKEIAEFDAETQLEIASNALGIAMYELIQAVHGTGYEVAIATVIQTHLDVATAGIEEPQEPTKH